MRNGRAGAGAASVGLKPLPHAIHAPPLRPFALWTNAMNATALLAAAADRPAFRIRDPADSRLAQDLRRRARAPTCRWRCAKSCSRRRRPCSAAKRIRRSPSTILPVPTPIRTRASICAAACRRCARSGSRSAATPNCCRSSVPNSAAAAKPTRAWTRCASRRARCRAWPRPAPTSPRCTTRARASSPRKWNTSPSARTSAWTRCAMRCC